MTGFAMVGRGMYVLKGTAVFIFYIDGIHKIARGKYDYHETENTLDSRGKAVTSKVTMYLYDMPEGCPFTMKMNLQQKNGKIVDTNMLALTATSPDYNVKGKKVAQTDPIWAKVSNDSAKVLFDELVKKRFIISDY
jgi:hypothetical protein